MKTKNHLLLIALLLVILSGLICRAQFIPPPFSVAARWPRATVQEALYPLGFYSWWHQKTNAVDTNAWNFAGACRVNGYTTNIQFTFGTQRTNTLYFTNGILKNVTHP